MAKCRYYGETATIVLEDNKICELSFQKEHEARRIVVDDTVTTFHQVTKNFHLLTLCQMVMVVNESD